MGREGGEGGLFLLCHCFFLIKYFFKLFANKLGLRVVKERGKRELWELRLTFLSDQPWTMT